MPWSTNTLRYCAFRWKLHSTSTSRLFGHGRKAKFPTKNKEGSYRIASCQKTRVVAPEWWTHSFQGWPWNCYDLCYNLTFHAVILVLVLQTPVFSLQMSSVNFGANVASHFSWKHNCDSWTLIFEDNLCEWIFTIMCLMCLKSTNFHMIQTYFDPEQNFENLEIFEILDYMCLMCAWS